MGSARCCLLAALLLVSGCASTQDVEDTCGSVLLAVVLFPCGIAFGIGCVAGAGERCAQGDQPEPGPSSTPSAEVSVELSAAEGVDAAY